MAIDTKLAAVNTAADTYIDALYDYMNDLTAGHKVHFVPIANLATNGATATVAKTEDGSGEAVTTVAARQTRFNVIVTKTTGDQAGRYLIADRTAAELLGVLPLVWKIWADGLQANSVTSGGDTAGY